MSARPPGRALRPPAAAAPPALGGGGGDGQPHAHQR